MKRGAPTSSLKSLAFPGTQALRSRCISEACWKSYAGMSLVDMQIAGRWSSPSLPALYARGQMASKTALAKIQARRRGRL